MLRTARQLSHDERAFEAYPQDKVTIAGLLGQAHRKAQDAQIEKNSFDTRVEANYDACFNLALIVLNAEGWKARAVDGHHRFTLEAACCAIGASEALFDRIDAIRQLRNLKYSGIGRTARDVEVAQKVANEFSLLALEWLQANHPAVLKPTA